MCRFSFELVDCLCGEMIAKGGVDRRFFGSTILASEMICVFRFVCVFVVGFGLDNWIVYALCECECERIV